MEDVPELVKVVGSRQDSEAMACLQRLLPDGDTCTEAGGSLLEQEGLTAACGKSIALAVKAPDHPLEETCHGPGH